MEHPACTKILLILVTVITIPQYTILGTVLYLTHNTDCKDEILELIELYLPTLLYDVLCRMDDPSHGHLCKISAGNPVCQTVQVS